MSKIIPVSTACERPLSSDQYSGLPVRDGALDLTRASLTLLVIAHHAVLAYHRYAPPSDGFNSTDMMWAAFPVVDAARAPVIDGLTLWNDSFFMAMMFLLAGLFTAPSLARKGAGIYLGDRVMRLGVPFIVSAAVLAPLAYWPAYLLRAKTTASAGFVDAWMSLKVWPAGPAWFLWVLLAFSLVAATLHVIAPRALPMLGRIGAWSRERPVTSCASFGVVVAVVYLITTHWVNPFIWSTWGPFAMQSSRVPLYAVYFLFGYALSAGGPGLLGNWMTQNGPLARRWPWWQAGAGVVFAGFVAALIVWLTLIGKGERSAVVDVVTNILFALTGVTTTFAVLATFARWGHRRHPVFASLARNAFGMYLVHYAIVTWTQYLLLGVAWPALAKAVFVTIFAIAASWGVAMGLRRIPGVARVI